MTAAQARVTGDPKDKATQLGPLASQERYKKVRSYLGCGQGQDKTRHGLILKG